MGWVVLHPAAAHTRRAQATSRRGPRNCPVIAASVPIRATARRGLSAPRVLPVQLLSPRRPELPARRTTPASSRTYRGPRRGTGPMQGLQGAVAAQVGEALVEPGVGLQEGLRVGGVGQGR